jgi:hypothetical protein
MGNRTCAFGTPCVSKTVFHSAVVRAALERLHLDDVRPALGQELTAKWHGDELPELDHLDPRERSALVHGRHPTVGMSTTFASGRHVTRRQGCRGDGGFLRRALDIDYRSVPRPRIFLLKFRDRC